MHSSAGSCGRFGSVDSAESYSTTCLDAETRELVPPAGLQLALLDPQRLRELRIVASDLLEEALGILAADEGVQRVTKYVAR